MLITLQRTLFFKINHRIYGVIQSFKEKNSVFLCVLCGEKNKTTKITKCLAEKNLDSKKKKIARFMITKSLVKFLLKNNLNSLTIKGLLC